MCYNNNVVKRTTEIKERLIVMSNYAKINEMDIANGEGIRVSIFFSGCTLHCKGCFNYELWDFNYGKPFTQKTIDKIIELMKPDYIKGLSILGGEPLQNAGAVTALCKAVKQVYPNKDIWMWTGYTMGYIEEKTYRGSCEVFSPDLFKNVDYIVAGEYKEELRNLNLRFRGSSNQHIFRKIDIDGIRTDWKRCEEYEGDI